MIVTIEIPAATRRKIARDGERVARANVAFTAAVLAGAQAGADEVTDLMQTGELGLTPQHGGEGLAGSISAWMLDRANLRAAFGVRGSEPAAAYARIHEEGGTIRPKNARSLAVPISDEAKKYSSPRDMANLTYIPRKGRPPLLVEQLAARGGRRAQWRIHWVLLQSVTIPARHWLTRGADRARPQIREAFSGRFFEVFNG